MGRSFETSSLPSATARVLVSFLPVMPMFERFVEPGRLALITYGPSAGKMCTIVDIVDHKRVVVDGPESVTGVRRHMMPLKRLSLTDLSAKMPRGAREKTLKKALVGGDVMKKWAATSWGKKLAATKTRKAMGDFDRFKLMVARKKRSTAVKAVLKKTKGGKKK